jgi:hypothetical protein
VCGAEPAADGHDGELNDASQTHPRPSSPDRPIGRTTADSAALATGLGANEKFVLRRLHHHQIRLPRRLLAAFSTQGLQFGADGFESPDCHLDKRSFAGRAIILSPLLRSAVASVGVVVRTWQDRAEFPVQHGRTIQFTGYRLYQQDLLIPFRISDLLRGQSTQTPLKISMRDLINWLRWSRSAHSRNRLRGSLLSLAMARFEVTSFSYERTRFRLFDSLQVEDDEIIGKLSGGFLKFQDATDANPRGTYIPIERWRALRCGLETWLAGWVLSTKCDTPIALQTLHFTTTAAPPTNMWASSVAMSVVLSTG